MRAVKISPKLGRALLALAKSSPSRDFYEDEVAALEQLLKPRPVSSQRRKTAQKRETRKEETARIRAEVFERADGRCELVNNIGRCVFPATEMDHFFPKGRTPQTVQTCWALCSICHRQKTGNYPTASWWLAAFVYHCDRNDYVMEAAKARARLEALSLVPKSTQEQKP